MCHSLFARWPLTKKLPCRERKFMGVKVVCRR